MELGPPSMGWNNRTQYELKSFKRTPIKNDLTPQLPKLKFFRHSVLTLEKFLISSFDRREIKLGNFIFSKRELIDGSWELTTLNPLKKSSTKCYKDHNQILWSKVETY
jgi:hypothetical protein